MIWKYCINCGQVHPEGAGCPEHPGRGLGTMTQIRATTPEMQSALDEVVEEERFSGLVFTVWNELSMCCQEDLIASRPGSIIRCTREDFELLAPIPLSEQTIALFKEAGDG